MNLFDIEYEEEMDVDNFIKGFLVSTARNGKLFLPYYIFKMVYII